jgi:hypothetical protein
MAWSSAKREQFRSQFSMILETAICWQAKFQPGGGAFYSIKSRH